MKKTTERALWIGGAALAGAALTGLGVLLTSKTASAAPSPTSTPPAPPTPPTPPSPPTGGSSGGGTGTTFQPSQNVALKWGDAALVQPIKGGTVVVTTIDAISSIADGGIGTVTMGPGNNQASIVLNGKVGMATVFGPPGPKGGFVKGLQATITVK